MTETTSTEAAETTTTAKSLPTDKVAKLVTQLGAGWARYGLTIGRLALQQSARALETTSELLGEVAAKFEKAAQVDASKEASKN